ncbi:EAL domain-containing protein [Phenylobacterium sp. J367]|nr:EAL domain-containing protein [Phenylobacterium sp. J367]MCR5878571.1 EAL domain-containing protein [Phenylobacterium sp. J367]
MILERFSSRLATLCAVFGGAGLLLLAVALFASHQVHGPIDGGALQVLGSLLALVGSAMIGAGCWLTLLRVSRRVTEIETAARRLAQGEDVEVVSGTDDELGRLADSFNAMAAAIRDRERRITHLALHDEETGLANRLSLERVVDGLRDRPHGQVHVAALGIRRFDHLRGAIGYALAAETVKIIGMRLSKLSPNSGVARIATDTLGFTLVAQGAAAALDDARRLLAELEQPLSIGPSGAIDVTFDLGLAPLDGALGASSAIEFASVALDQARASRRKVTFFDAEAYGHPAANLSLMSSLARALETGAIELHYQPKFDLRRREVTGVEALARWRHPVRGLLPPDLFVGMAEETGHIRALTEWALKRAIADQGAPGPGGLPARDEREHLRPHARRGRLRRLRARRGAPRRRQAGVRDHRDGDHRGPGTGVRHAGPLRRGRRRRLHRRLRHGPVVARLSQADPRPGAEDRPLAGRGRRREPARRHDRPLDHRPCPQPRPEGHRRGRRDRGGLRPAGRHGLRPGAGLPDRQAHAAPRPAAVPRQHARGAQELRLERVRRQCERFRRPNAL